MTTAAPKPAVQVTRELDDSLRALAMQAALCGYTYRDEAYVRAEVESLARQAREAAEGGRS